MPEPPLTKVPGFHIMAKPIGPVCNLQCRYCFYLEKDQLYPDATEWRMPEEVLDSFIRQYVETQESPEITFAWQGGEPTLLGIGFFENVVRLQKAYANGKTIKNAFQTNGILIDDAWAAFFAANNFLVGLSIDGPEEFHDKFRRDRGGRPTFARVADAMARMKRHGAEFNTLTCVQRHNANHPLEVYRFLKEAGSGFMQFIPIVERIAESPREDGLTLIKPGDGEALAAPWCVQPRQYGEFLTAIFDEWVRNDVGAVFVQLFDITLAAWMGYDPPLCVFREVCGEGLALEHNGDLYSCDHFVYPENRLGNILETPLIELVTSAQQRQFGEAKRDCLPEYCRKCAYRFACHGECPKHRFLTSPGGEPHLNYLCEGYKHFFAHAEPYMRFMAMELQAQRPAANIMQHLRMQELHAAGKKQPGPNDPCFCGSGKKYKKCCGRRV